MRTPNSSSTRLILATGIVALLGLSKAATAQTFTWDPGADGDSTVGGTGTWNLTNTFWDPIGTDLLADNVVWPNSATSVALFRGTPGAVTINTGAGVTANRLLFNTSGYTINSSIAADLLTLGGTNPSITVTNAGDSARINSVIAGSAGLTVSGLGGLVLGGTNTITGQMTIATGATVGLNAAAGLGATGTGNETIVQAGGTLNIGGQSVNNNPAPATPGEEIRIAGTGVGGIGAIVSSTGTGTNTLAKVVLTADATINAGGLNQNAFGAGGNILNTAGGRIDIRLNAAPTAGQKHLDLAGFTLTKNGQHLLALVNADVSNGNIVVDEGQMNFEAGTIVTGAADGSNGTVTVNPNGKLGFWSVTNAANITRPIVVNGGTIGDPTATGAAQTINAPISFTGSINPNFTATSTTAANVTTLAGVISKNAAFTGTELAKRGAGVLAFSNAGNSYDVKTTIYQGNLQANYTTAFTGGVAPASPVLLTGTPLGTNNSVVIAGGTLNIRVDGAADATNQVFSIGKTITLDRAPGGINLDRLTSTGGTDKNLAVSIVFAPPSAANGYSIGQNQLTGTQTDAFRTQITGMTMNGDTVLNVGDFTINGDATSANKNSLVHIGGNSWGFIGGTTQEFNAAFNLGNANFRIGSMYGTGVTNDTVTAGTGAIYNAPNTGVTIRTPTNLASGQTIELVSQRVTQSTINLEQFTSVPTNLRALGSGVLGVGSTTTFGDVDLSRIGDGTFRIGSNFIASGNGNVVGVVSPGAGNVVRLGAAGTTTLTGTNRVTGSAALDVGSDLINGGFRTYINGAAQNGTVILTGPNNYSGGTTVNRSSTLRIQDASLGAGAVNNFGVLTAEGSAGTFINGAANLPVSLYGGSTLRFDNSALTTAVDTDRWLDTQPISLTAGTLQLDARNNNSTTNEVVGAISYAGGSTISLQRNNVGTSQIVQLQTPSLTRSGTGTLEVTRSGSSSFQTNVKLLVTGTAPTVTNGMVNPSITTLDATSFTNFATYAPTGLGNAVYTNKVITAAFPTGLTAGTDIVYVDFATGVAATTLGDNPSIYALKVGAGNGTVTATSIASGVGTQMTIRSGGLIISGDSGAGNFSTSGSAGTATISPAVIFNDGTNNIEALVNTRSGQTGVLAGAVTAAGLTKFGAGTLNLTADNATTLSGTVAVNQGTLQLVGPAVTGNFSPAGTGQILLNGGTLNLRSNATTAVAYTLQNTGITIGQNIPIATVDVNRGDTTSTGIALTINPATAASPGLVLNGSAGVQGQTFNLTGGNTYSLVFGSNASNSFAGNVTINNAVNLTLNNAPAITGTNPVITKSGAGTLLLGVAAGTQAVPAGTQIVVNGGVLEPRSIQSFGPVANTTLVLNAGTLNLRRDSSAVWSGNTNGSGAGYPLVVNGNSTLSADRVSAGSNFRLGLGKLTLNNAATFTVNNGNGVSADFQGAQINGTTFITSNVAAGDQDSALRFLSGFDVAGGALVKQGSGHLHLLNSGSTYSGGTFVQQGTLRVRAANALGTGTVFLNPGATLDFNAVDNLATGQQLIVRGNGSFLPMISVNTDIAHPTANVNTSAAPVGIIGLSNGSAGVYDSTINLGIYGGKWSFGGVSAGAYDPRFTGASIVAGANNLYRLGGGGTSFAMGTDSAGVGRTNVLTGPNNVRIGFDSGNILAANATNFQFSIAGVNDFSGGSTVIERGMIARLFSNNDGTRSGLSNSAVDVFGVLGLSGAASFDNGTANTNAVTFHPGSLLVFDNLNGAANSVGSFAAANNNNRWNDTTPIALNGAMLNVIGGNNVATTETVGNVTYSAGARIRSGRSGTGTTVLTLANLSAAPGKGNTLQLQANALGGTTPAGAATTVADLIKVAGNAPTVTNGMVSSAIINATDNTFTTYDATNGFANIVYDKTLNATYAAGSLLPTDKVDVGTAGLTLSDNPTVYALRTSQSINNGGPFNQITVRSGGLIGTAGTISPNLVFNNGTANTEARIYVNGTLTINGQITADGITKFGHNATAGGVAGTLVINVPQPNYASGWTVNSGTLQISDPQGLGQSVAGNGVTLNGAQSFGGQVAVQYAQTNLTFARDSGSPELVTFSGGPITVVNEATIRAAGADNRNLQIPNVVLDSTGTGSAVSFTFDVPNNRYRATIPTLTLQDDAVIRVLDSGSTTDTGRITAGVVNSLVGAGKNLSKIGNRTLELAGNSSTTFTGGSITVSQGTVRVLDNGALGSASTAVTIERNATLEIGKSNFVSTATVSQLPGSIERWNVEDARGAATYNLPAGVNLQLNTNLVSSTPRTIGLNGGSMEGFLWIDHPSSAVQRTIGPAVTVNLLANSLVGQNILQGQGYDAGRQPTVAQPFGDNVTGAFLRIDGNITGAFDLTKTGLDTVVIAGSANTYNNTVVDMGVLRIGRTNALPIGKTLTTRLGGIFDLYGNDQTVAGLGTATGGVSPGGVSVGSSGRVVNSGITDNTLRVNNSANYTYNGAIEGNVALTKAGLGTLTLATNDTYVGATIVEAGTLEITGSISGSRVVDVQSGAKLDVSSLTGGLSLGVAQTLKGNGTLMGDLSAAGTVSPGASPGTLTVTGQATFFDSSKLAIEIASATSFDKLSAQSLTLAGTVNLTLDLGYVPVAGTAFQIANNLGAAPVVGQFTWAGPEGILSQGEQFSAGGQMFTISYTGGTGNDVVLTAVPEPGVAVSLAGGLGLLLAFRRRRQD